VVRVVLVVAALAVVLLRLDRPPPTAAPERQAIERLLLGAAAGRLAPADNLGDVVTAAGDAWMSDPVAGSVLRLDGRDGRVLARIPVAGRVDLAADGRSVWALRWGGRFWRRPNGPLLQINPLTNRILQRIPLRVPSGDPVVAFGVLAGENSIWVWGPRHVLRFDVATRLVIDAVVGDRHGELTGAALVHGGLIAVTADGHLVRFDAWTGTRTRAGRAPVTAVELRAVAGRRVLATAHGTLYALDVDTGRLVWSRRLGFHVGAIVRSGGIVLAQGAALGDLGDRLWAIDVRTGRVLATMVLPSFGTAGMAAVDGALWITIATGQVMVLPRWLTRRFVSHANERSST
jgi:hypothetical protein